MENATSIICIELIGWASAVNNLLNNFYEGNYKISKDQMLEFNSFSLFLKEVKMDSITYLSKNNNSQKEVNKVFINFLIGLSFIKDELLLKSPSYAIDSVITNSFDWSKALSGFNEEKKRKLITQLDKWINVIDKLSSGEGESNLIITMSEIYYSVKSTISLIQ